MPWGGIGDVIQVWIRSVGRKGQGGRGKKKIIIILIIVKHNNICALNFFKNIGGCIV